MQQGIGMLEAQKEGLHSWNRRGDREWDMQ